MKKLIKFLIITALILIVSGGVLFTTGILINGGVPMTKYKTETYTDLSDFSDIDISVSTADVNICKSTDGKAKVTCFENEKEPHQVTVVDKKLKISVQNNKKWYDYIALNFKTTKITIELPEKDYISLTAKVSTGDLVINNLSFEKIDIEGTTGDVNINEVSANNLNVCVTTGDVCLKNSVVDKDIAIEFSTGDAKLENLSATNLSVKGRTGAISMYNAIFSGKMEISSTTGDVNFNRCEASEIKINLTTGDVKGSFLSSKIFIVDTDTGRKQVPNTTEGGVCEITTSTGDIKITIAP